MIPYRDGTRYKRQTDSDAYDGNVTWHWVTANTNGIIYDTLDKEYYVIAGSERKQDKNTTVRESVIPAKTGIGSDGQAFYFYKDVKPGDRILNTSLVSVESFSLFEGLQITCPSLPFNPMITTFSSGMRVLCEIRLNFDYTGNSDESGRVINTSDEMISDIIWNASEHQYCQLTTGAMKLYNLVCQIELVYRDSSIPPKPIFIPPGGIFQVKCRLVTTE